jgi:hypothetical protein
VTPRPPVVAGAVRGSGATTLAVALRGHDAGSLDGPFTGRADLLVCRGDEPGLRAAAAVAVAGRVRPVLAVVPAGPVPRERLRALEPRFGAVVVLPHLARWEGAPTPVDEAAAVLARSGEELPRELRELAAGLHRLVHALLATGVLAQGAPPFVTRAVDRARGTHPTPVGRGPAITAPRAGGRPRQDMAAGVPRRPIPRRPVPPVGVAPVGAAPDRVAAGEAAPRRATPGDATPRGAAPGDPALPGTAPGSPIPSSRARSGAAPGHPAPRTTAPTDATPRTTAASDAAPRTTAASDAAPRTTAASDAAPRTTAASDVAPRGAAPSDAAPNSPAPTDAAPSAAPGGAAPSAAPGGAAPSGAAPGRTTRGRAAPAGAAPAAVPAGPPAPSPELDDDAIEALVLAAVG